MLADEPFDPGPTPGDHDTLPDVSLASVESPLYRSRIPFYCFGFDLFILRQTVKRRETDGSWTASSVVLLLTRWDLALGVNGEMRSWYLILI